MLAVTGRPFDSAEHFFEFKWDGYRAGAMIENGKARLMSRNGLDLAERYPGLAPLARLPRGLALDGEIVAFRGGRPDFSLLQQHGPRSDPSTVRFVAFDVLYEDFESRLDLPFSRRRQILEQIVERAHQPGAGLERGPCGRRPGFVPPGLRAGPGGRGVQAPFQSLRLRPAQWSLDQDQAAPPPAGRDHRLHPEAGPGFPEPPGGGQRAARREPEPGALRYLGRVGSGFTESLRARVNALLQERPRRTPLVPCPEKARWVEPGLFCEVSFAELTSAGLLRAPVFERLIEE